MRWAASVAALGLVIAVFALTSPPEPEATPAPPAPTPPAPEAEDPTVETEEPVATTVPDRGPPAVSRVLGILPDGTRYSVRIDPGVPRSGGRPVPSSLSPWRFTTRTS